MTQEEEAQEVVCDRINVRIVLIGILRKANGTCGSKNNMSEKIDDYIQLTAKVEKKEIRDPRNVEILEEALRQGISWDKTTGKAQRKQDFGKFKGIFY